MGFRVFIGNNVISEEMGMKNNYNRLIEVMVLSASIIISSMVLGILFYKARVVTPVKIGSYYCVLLKQVKLLS